MDDVTRRRAMGMAAGAGLATALAPGAAAGPDDDPQGDGTGAKAQAKAVMAAGMTEAEAECWNLAGDLAGKFFALPEMHPMDKQEIATAIHVVQNKLLSRPTYRRYLEEMKKGLGEK